VVGAALGVLSMAGVYIAVAGWRHPGHLAEPFGAAAVFGGVLGFVLAPVAAWTLMRHVPLWRAIAETALGTVLGFAAGWVLGPTGLRILGYTAPWPFLFALGGFAAAAIRLRLMHGVARPQ
jgi:hypothetical protein